MSSAAPPTTAAGLPPTAPVGDRAPTPWLAQVWRHTVARAGARLGLVWIVLVAAIAVLAPLLANSFPILVKADGRIFSPMLQHLGGPDVLLLILAAGAAIVLPWRRAGLARKLTIVFWFVLIAIPLVFWPDLTALPDALATAPERPAVGRVMAGLAALLVLLDIALAIWIFVRARLGWTVRIFMLAGAALLGAVLVVHPVNPPARIVYDQYRVLDKQGKLDWAIWAPIPYSPGDRLFDQFDPDQPHPWQPSWLMPAKPWNEHLLGTNEFKADILSHMVHACRIAMAVGLISTGISMLIGIVIGGLMGYFVGLVDLLGMRLVEIFGAVPTIYLLLTFVAAFPEYRSIYLIMAIIGFTSWVGDARFVRAEFLRLRGQDFVHAAIAAGLPLRRVLFRHLLPNALAPLLVSASFGVAGAVLAESTLSFLGLGVPVGEASWGALLSQAVKAGGGFYWWLAIFPGLAIFLTVFAYNLIGEALRDALDPRLAGGA